MTPARTNVVVVIADDMGYGDLGLHNGGRSSTPHLNALAEQGVRLAQHYSGSPVCSPARASFLTGRYPHRTGAVDTLHGRGLDRIALSEVTVADVFRAAGYRTGIVGKWHNGALDRRFHPNARGFDEFAGFSGGYSDYYNYTLDVNGTDVAGDGRYLTDVLTEHAASFVRRHAATPFFLVVAYNAPHFPMQAPSDVVQRYRSRGETLGAALTYAMIEVMDRGIGRLDGTLRDLGLLDDTILLFTSDNGPYLGEVQGVSLARSNHGLRGAKHYVFEGGIRVPAIVRWPSRLPAGSVSAEPTHFTDWLPTLAAATGVPVPTALDLDGDDVLAVLRGERPLAARTRCWQSNRYAPRVEGNAAIRDGDWKLVRPAIPSTMVVTEEDREIDRALNLGHADRIAEVDDRPLPEPESVEPGEPMLFDLATDPGEARDLAGTFPERVAELSHALDAWFDEVESERSARLRTRSG